MRKKSIYILLICLITFQLSSCSIVKNDVTVSDTQFVLDTFVTIKIFDRTEGLMDQMRGQTEEENNSLLKEAFQICRNYDNLFSRTIEKSDISRLNHANGEFVAVSAEVLELIKKGIVYYTLSEGTFDITIGAISEQWNFKTENPTPPSDESIQNALASVRIDNIEIKENLVRLKNPNTHIDLGGIAKGYIADKLSQFLKEKGVTSALINLGGNIVTVGEKLDGTNWSIGIQKPFEAHNELAGMVEVGEKSIVSSGVYERYFYHNDTFYHHILNPKTGYPVETDLLSVSIISDLSVDGDALSTTVFELGVDKGMALIESLEDTEAVFILSNGEIVATSGIGTTIPFEKE